MERRTFIIGGVAGGVGLAQYIFVSRYMNSMRASRGGISVRAFQKFGPQAALVAITPNGDFYITSKGSTPNVIRNDWRLQIDGLVTRPLTLTYRDILALPQIEPVMTLECISNPIGGNFLGNARWTGTPLAPLLERVRPLAEATTAVIHAADGYTTGIPMERMWEEENFLAYKMNGEILPPAHGYPLRIFLPGKFGMKQPKWVTRIELIREKYLGYWEKKGWSDDSERAAHARFTDLKDGAKFSGENLELIGYALGPLEGIRAVEVSFDEGASWQQAELSSNPSPLAWTFWRYLWMNPQPGKYGLLVRAIDNEGRVQPPDPQHIFPDGATGRQRLTVTVI